MESLSARAGQAYTKIIVFGEFDCCELNFWAEGVMLAGAEFFKFLWQSYGACRNINLIKIFRNIFSLFFVSFFWLFSSTGE